MLRKGLVLTYLLLVVFVVLFAATEDFTTFTEVDPNAHIAKIAGTITFTALHRDEDAYVYKDYTAAHFAGDFTHYIDVYIDDFTLDGVVYPWSVTNTIDDGNGIKGANGDMQCIMIRNASGTYHIEVRQYENGNDHASTSYEFALDTTYYLTIVRDEAVGAFGTLYCYIYDNVARGGGDLLDTLTLTLSVAKVDFRYCFGTQSHDSNMDGRNVTGTSANLDLNEAEEEEESAVFFGMNMLCMLVLFIWLGRRRK